MIHIYTGNGKGKTTAAFGIAVRALCAGKRVFIGQFVKSMRYSEANIDQHFTNVVIEQFGDGCLFHKTPSKESVRIAKLGLLRCKEILYSHEYDMVILDEINIALYYHLFELSEVIDILAGVDRDIEVILTGRYAMPELIERADLVTEMREVKHYFQDGVVARVGIER